MSFLSRAVGHRMMGAPVVQCGYFEVATVEQCPETGVPRLGLCPEHYVYSLCGDGAHCQHRAQIRGKCVEHAHAVICRQQDCRRKVEDGTTSGEFVDARCSGSPIGVGRAH
eukprot:37311-Eustigmatos_ZCMA.PRE.1